MLRIIEFKPEGISETTNYQANSIPASKQYPVLCYGISYEGNIMGSLTIERMYQPILILPSSNTQNINYNTSASWNAAYALTKSSTADLNGYVIVEIFKDSGIRAKFYSNLDSTTYTFIEYSGNANIQYRFRVDEIERSWSGNDAFNSFYISRGSIMATINKISGNGFIFCKGSYSTSTFSRFNPQVTIDEIHSNNDSHLNQIDNEIISLKTSVSTNTSDISSMKVNIASHTNSINNNNGSIQSLETTVEANRVSLNNQINVNSDEISRLSNLISDIDLDSIQNEMQGKINEVNQAISDATQSINQLENQVDQKVEELNTTIQEMEQSANDIITDTRNEIENTINSFNNSFSQEIAETKTSIKRELNEALAEINELQEHVDENIEGVRESVESIIDDVEGTMRSVVTSIACVR